MVDLEFRITSNLVSKYIETKIHMNAISNKLKSKHKKETLANLLWNIAKPQNYRQDIVYVL